MERALTDLPFDEWVAHVFGHEVAQPQRYFAPDAAYWQAPTPLTLAHVTRLFENPGPPLAPYSDAQLNQGFWYLVSSGSGSEHMFSVFDERAPLEIRCRCLRAFVHLFRTLFALRCSEHLLMQGSGRQ